VVREPNTQWIRDLFSFALVPDLVLYLKIDMESLIPRAIESGGMNYWEAGMDLHMGQDLFDSFVNYQSTLINEYNKLTKEFDFEVIDACKSVDEMRKDIQERVKLMISDKPKHPAKSKDSSDPKEDAKK